MCVFVHVGGWVCWVCLIVCACTCVYVYVSVGAFVWGVDVPRCVHVRVFCVCLWV